MSGMNQYLSEYFGTGAPAEDEIQKQAQVELFLKLAEEEGIDIDQLDDDQVEELYASTFAEGDDGGEEVDEDGLEVQAAAEWAQQKEAADKLAEAEDMGRNMARFYVDELNKIAASGVSSAASKIKGYGGSIGRSAGYYGGAAGRRIKEIAAGSKEKGLREAGKQLRGKVKGSRVWDAEGNKFVRHHSPANRAALGEMKGFQSAARKERNIRRGAAVGAGAAAFGAGGLAAKGVRSMTTEKKAAALDMYAGNLALEKLAEAGWNVEEAAERLNAVMTLDEGEGTKIASANTLEEAIDIRSVELAELAGYPVE